MLALLVLLVGATGALVPRVARAESCDAAVEPGDSVQAAIVAAAPGDTICVEEGTYAGAVVDKEVHLRARGDVVINDGPYSHAGIYKAGFLFDNYGDNAGSGSSITGFNFQGAAQHPYGAPDDGKLDFAVFSRRADSVTIKNNTMTMFLQAVTNWNGSGWRIKGNEVHDLWTYCGGGIGIITGGFDGATVADNVISNNEVTGTLHVPDNDCGGAGGLYDGSGIVLYADFRFGSPGPSAVINNKINDNDVSITSNNPDIVNVNGIELTETDDNPLTPPLFVVHNNKIVDNDAEDLGRWGIGITGAADNLIADNEVNGSGEFDCYDDTTGAGTSGTANTWNDNDGDTSSPPGLCGDDDDGDEGDEDDDDEEDDEDDD